MTSRIGAYLVCGAPKLHQSQWAVFTAIVVIQASIDASGQLCRRDRLDSSALLYGV